MMMPSRCAETVGVDRARMDRVDLHAVALAEIGQRLHEGELRADHRGADHVVGDRRARADAADGDDRAAARFQQRPGRAAEPHLREELEREAVVPVGVGSSKKSPRRAAPALLTRISSRPKRCAAALASAAGASRSRRSAAWTSALRPSARTASATPSSAPAIARRSAADRSRPPPARARWPCRCRGSRRSPARLALKIALIRHRLRIAAQSSTRNRQSGTTKTSAAINAKATATATTALCRPVDHKHRPAAAH